MRALGAPCALVIVLAAGSGCAAVTPPPRFSIPDPADAAAPEAAVPPVSRVPVSEPERTSSAGPSVYVCPMHPETVSDRPGPCPVCEMSLQKREGKPSRRP